MLLLMFTFFRNIIKLNCIESEVYESDVVFILLLLVWYFIIIVVILFIYIIIFYLVSCGTDSSGHYNNIIPLLGPVRAHTGSGLRRTSYTRRGTHIDINHFVGHDMRDGCRAAICVLYIVIYMCVCVCCRYNNTYLPAHDVILSK